ncbi:MAG: hypothetical protein LCH84_12960 [Gemmatimonadetes bacterium]|nr:hypothetical protein [Gemmatimonadota bacterium]
MPHSRPPVPPASPPPAEPRPPRRKRVAVQGLPTARPRNARALAIAVLVHVVLVVAVMQWITFGHGLPNWMRFGNEQRPREERLQYVATRDVAPPVSRTPAATRPNAAPTQPAPAQPAPAAPAEPPAAGPPAIPTAPRDTGAGAPPGNGIGALDPRVRGVRPGYTDERVWRGTGGGAGGTGAAFGGGGTGADNLDSIMAGGIMAARDSLDSLARAQGKYGRAPGDWTRTDKNGNKWGWDQGGIRLGKVVIPNALLALLPLNAATAANMSGNMAMIESGRRTAAATADIQRMSARGAGDAEFRRIVKEMDARRDTERRARLRAPSASVAAPLKDAGKSESKSGPP